MTLPKPHRPRASGRVTLAEVAAAAGVSVMTASRALRNARNVGDELAARVREAAAKLKYVPDPIAQNLASSRSRNVVVLVPSLSNRVFGDLVDSLQVSLLAAGYQTLFGVTHYDPQEEERLVESYLAFKPAGLVLSNSLPTERTRRLLAGCSAPRVQVMDIPEPAGGYAVGFSQWEAARTLTQHLIDRGRRRIAFIGVQLDPRVMQRAAGYRDCLRSAGLDDPALEILDPRPSSMGLGQILLERALQLAPKVDAIFFCNDDVAQGALLATARLGIEVPRELAIAGFNDLEGSALMQPGLTSVRTPRAEIGRQTARLLTEILRGDEPALKTIDLGFELMVRGST